MSHIPGLDAYITGGRYSSSTGTVTCHHCEEETTVTAETEYGATTWTPEECKKCGREFVGNEKWEDPEDPRDEYDPDSFYDGDPNW